MKNICLSLLLTFVSVMTFTQIQAQPEVGKPMPDFTLNNITRYKATGASLNDFKGKWLFLDLWSINCKGCIESFPKINSLQDEFPEVQFLLVGRNDRKYSKGIEKLYERVSANKNINVSAAFDTVTFEKWNIQTVPHIYIIDPDGILRFITDGRDMTKEKIADLLSGKTVSFYAKNTEYSTFDIKQEYGDKLQYISLLTEWNREKQSGGLDIDLYTRPQNSKLWKDGWSAIMVPLYELYCYAYLGKAFFFYYDTAFYGRVWPFPVLEIRDTSFFQFDYNENVGIGTYNYYLKIPDEKVTQDNVMKEIQRALSNVFGYEVSFETRQMPYWKIVGKPGAEKKLKSRKAGEPFFSSGNAVFGFTLRNYAMKDIVRFATASLPNNERLAFLDETGITYPIDITMDADMTSYEDVRKNLNKYGLDLVKGKKEMKVLVIRDPEN